MKTGFGLVSCQLYPGDPRPWSDLYREALHWAKRAEVLGLDSIWTTEHHFVDDGYMPSQLVTAAAMAARTNRIRIGTGVLLAPLHDPLRLAEDAATVELISEGRLELGLGLGWSEIEFEAFGADLTRRGRAMDDILTILPAAWSGEPVHHKGAVHSVDGIAVRPTPTTDIPIIIGGHAEPALRRAARFADGFLSTAGPERFAHQVAVVEDEMERINRAKPFRWIDYRMLYVADDPDQGWQEVRPYVHYIRWKYEDMVASAARNAGLVPTPPEIDPATEAHLREATLVGPPELIAEAVVATAERAGVDLEFVARSYYPGMPFWQQDEQLTRFAEQVVPLLDT